MQSQHRKTKEKAKKIWPYWDWESMAGQQSQTTVTLELEDGLKIHSCLDANCLHCTLVHWYITQDLFTDEDGRWNGRQKMLKIYDVIAISTYFIDEIFLVLSVDWN